MFTGIIERTGKIISIEAAGSNKSYWIASDLSSELSIDQSVAHQGVCLTVDRLGDDKYRVTAIKETLKKTNLNDWRVGDLINLERCLQMNGRIDGHIVQGHVDTTAECIGREEKAGSTEFTFQFDSVFAALVIEKGSVAVNGTSLTAFNVGVDRFTVAIIPYTMEHTSIKNVVPGINVNIEFDMVGKYLLRMQELKNKL